MFGVPNRVFVCVFVFILLFVRQKFYGFVRNPSSLSLPELLTNKQSPSARLLRGCFSLGVGVT